MYNILTDKTILLPGSRNCLVTGSCRNVTLMNCQNVSAIATSGVVAINCSDILIDNNNKGWTLINNSRKLKNGWGDINYGNAPATFPYSLGSSATVDKYRIDLSGGGDCYVVFDLTALNGCDISLKIIGTGNNLIITTTNGTGNFDGSAVPYTITPTIYDSYKISSDGTNLYII